MKSKKSKIISYLLLVVAVLLFLPGCTTDEEEKKHSRTMLIMDTQVDVTYYHPSSQAAQTDIAEMFAEMERLEKILSRHAADSDVQRINEAAGREPVQVQPETLYVLRHALEFAELSDGAFDPTIAPLLEAWGFGGDSPAVPTDHELIQARKLVDFRLVEIDEEKESVFLTVKGMKLDLGGIAKGYIVDRGQEHIRKTAKASFINAGGDISISGRKPTDEDWRVGVQDPAYPESLIAIINMEEGAVATSGDYQRYFEEEGHRYHHIINPATGKPADELSSVTVVAGDAMTADALSTAVFVLGEGKGMALLESVPGADVILVNKNGEVAYTEDLADRLDL